MSLYLLKRLRFIVPGILFYIFYYLMGVVTKAWTPVIPTNMSDIVYTLPVLIVAFIYEMLPFRNWSNTKYDNDVSENLRKKLISISNFKENDSEFDWEKVSGVFYHFVDKDDSLRAKSKLAYHNGFFWTTVADIRAISLLFVVMSLVLILLGINEAPFSLLIFVCIFVLSFIFSSELTRRHKGIGDEQIEIIQHKYLDELNSMLGAALHESSK
jgi:hypothetical protein